MIRNPFLALLAAGLLVLTAIGCGGDRQPPQQGQPPGGSPTVGGGTGTVGDGTSGTGTASQGTSGTASSGTSTSGTSGTAGAAQAPRSLAADTAWRPVAASSGVPRMLQAESARDLSLFVRGEDDPVNALPQEAAAQRQLRGDEGPRRALAPQREVPRGIAVPETQRPLE